MIDRQVRNQMSTSRDEESLGECGYFYFANILFQSNDLHLNSAIKEPLAVVMIMKHNFLAGI